jgi:uncharacterized protein YegL
MILGAATFSSLGFETKEKSNIM